MAQIIAPWGVRSILQSKLFDAGALWSGLPNRLYGSIVNALGRSGARPVGEAEMRRSMRSDKIYIFGAGYSLSQLAPDDWAAIERHNTMGFSFFLLQKFVRMDFHLIRELGYTSHDSGKREDIWRRFYATYGAIMRENERYKDTTYVVQAGFRAFAGNRFVGLGYLPKDSKLFRFRNGLRGFHPPATSFADGLTHGPGTVTDCVNFASVVGWRRIVLCGVDLYDRRYFWQSENCDHYGLPGITDRGGGEYAGEGDIDAMHRTAAPMRRWAMEWRDYYAGQGISLEVLNPKSLLAGILPVHKLHT